MSRRLTVFLELCQVPSKFRLPQSLRKKRLSLHSLKTVRTTIHGIWTRFPNTNVAWCHATKKTRTSPYYLLQSGIFVYEGSAFFILFLSFCGSLTNGEYRKKINKHWILRYAQNDNIKKLSFKRAFYKKYYT